MSCVAVKTGERLPLITWEIKFSDGSTYHAVSNGADIRVTTKLGHPTRIKRVQDAAKAAIAKATGSASS